jgi:3-deoxy-D-manno-octulosonate 8-phosphate phosphatase KdsC-like HAD superfamily phosphatase
MHEAQLYVLVSILLDSLQRWQHFTTNERLVVLAPRVVDAGLVSTINLGKADVYPATSGKAQVAGYLARHYGVPLEKSAFICDDDNDVELAKLVGRAYCPAISSVRPPCSPTLSNVFMPLITFT